MAKGLLILAWVVFVGLFQQYQMEPSPRLVCGNYSITRVKKAYAVIMLSIPFVFAAFKTDFVDAGSYLFAYNRISTDSIFTDFISSYSKDNLLFYAIEYFFKKYISSDAIFFFSVVAFLQLFLLGKTLRRYSEDFRMSIYIFISSALFLSWICNGIRQFIVVTILFALTQCILKNKWYIFLPVVLLLSGLTPIYRMFGWGTPPWFLCGIHQSALIMIPIYFLVRGKALTKKVWILLFAFIVLVVLGELNSFLETSTQNTMYAADLEYIDDSSGSNPIRFFVSLVPIVLVLLKRNEIITEYTPAIINLSINMSFVSATLHLVSVFTSGIFVGRLPIYCELYNLILLPYIINRFNEATKRNLTIGLYVLYLLYYCYQLFFAWSNATYSVEIFGLKF